MRPLLWPRMSCRSSKPTPAARNRRPHVCLRSCTRTRLNPSAQPAPAPLGTGLPPDAGRLSSLSCSDEQNDGGDTHSTISFGDLMTLIRASDVTVYSVGFLEHSRGRIEERAHLQQIAEATGGQAFFPTSMKDIEASYDKVVAQIRAQYSLAYSSTNTKQDGAWRKVEIRVTRPDLKGSKILARRGYFAPYQEIPNPKSQARNPK